MKPRLLDLYCGAGGATRGYQNAGFHVVGLDIKDQLNYCGDDFIRADALEWLDDYLTRPGFDFFYGTFDAIHASPPCQAYSKTQRIRNREHPDLIGPTRDLLERTGLPYVIENVPGSPLLNPVRLEGQALGLYLYRPRHFETNWQLVGVPIPFPPPPPQAKMGRRPKLGEAVQVIGNFSGVAAARAAMGIDWMTRDELREAIPPAMTEWVGAQLLLHVRAKETAQ